MAEKRKDDRHTPRSGAVVPEDTTTGDLATWLHKLWARNNPPERIEVWQVFNPHKSVRGQRIYGEDFNPNDKKDIEQCTKLANEIVGTAQNDCDSVRRPQDYEIAVIDRNRGAGPTCRRLDMYPKRTYLSQYRDKERGATGAGDGGDDDFDQPLNWRTMQLKEIELSHERLRWGEQRNDAVLGETIRLFREEVLSQRNWITNLMSANMKFFLEVQDAKNLETDRMIARKKAEVVSTLMEEGMGVLRMAIPAIFGNKNPNAQPATLPASSGAQQGNETETDYGPSDERTIVDKFLRDCHAAQIDIALFGDWERRDGKPFLLKKGIFGVDQFKILFAVAEGKMPPSALDVLMPNSGHALAITGEQLMEAQPHVMPRGLDKPLLQLVGLRNRRQTETVTTSTEPTERQAS